MIKAECHSDDYVACATFDATPWFEQASDEEIRALAECDWGGDQPADGVAVFIQDKDPKVGRLFDYLSFEPKMGHEPVGFECHVDVADARRWLDANRPALAAEIFGDGEHRSSRN